MTDRIYGSWVRDGEAGTELHLLILISASSLQHRSAGSYSICPPQDTLRSTRRRGLRTSRSSPTCPCARQCFGPTFSTFAPRSTRTQIPQHSPRLPHPALSPAAWLRLQLTPLPSTSSLRRNHRHTIAELLTGPSNLSRMVDTGVGVGTNGLSLQTATRCPMNCARHQASRTT